MRLINSIWFADHTVCVLSFTLQRDRITSFRKTGMKKEKLLIQHPTDTPTTPTELPLPQPLFDDRSLNLSEKEIIDLFEKMMVRLLRCAFSDVTCAAECAVLMCVKGPVLSVFGGKCLQLVEVVVN